MTLVRNQFKVMFAVAFGLAVGLASLSMLSSTCYAQNQIRLAKTGLLVTSPEGWRQMNVADSLNVNAVEFFLQNTSQKDQQRMIFSRVEFVRPKLSLCAQEAQQAKTAGLNVKTLRSPKSWDCVFEISDPKRPEEKPRLFASRVVPRTSNLKKISRFWSVVAVVELHSSHATQFTDWLSTMKQFGPEAKLAARSEQ